MGFWAADGFVSHADTRSCIKLMGEEVLPAVREIGKELGLWSPFEANAPTGRKFPDPAVPAGALGHGGPRAGPPSPALRAPAEPWRSARVQ